MEGVRQDLLYAVRACLRAPGPTAVLLVLLVLGSGLNTAVFSVVNEALIRPLPYREPDRLVFVTESHPRRGSGAALRPANFLDWRARNSVFEAATSFFPFDGDLTGEGEPERISAQRVLEDFFPLLGVPALVGRTFGQGDYEASGAKGTSVGGDVVVLSYGIWQRRYAADPDVIGRTLRLNGRPLTVVGVMPAEFQGVGAGPLLWVPWVLTPDERANRQTHEFFSLARIKTSVSLEQAQAQMSVLYRQLGQQYPADNRDWGVKLTPWREVLLGETRLALLVLLGAAGLILLIASANVAGLLLARAVDREQEMAIRLALGASPGRIVRQLLVEGLLLAAVSGALALLVAHLSLHLLSGFSLPTAVPFAFHPRLDLRVFGVTTAASLICGLLFALAPAIKASNVDLRKGIFGRVHTGRDTQRIRHFLVLGQMAVVFVLLTASGLVLRTFLNLRNTQLGFDPRRLLTVQLSLPESRYPTDDDVSLFIPRALDEVRSIPGVLDAASTSDLPLIRLVMGMNLRFAIEGRQGSGSDEWSAGALSVSPTFFRTMGSRTLKGRAFDERDLPQGPGVVMIDETLAHEYWPGEDPLGKRIEFLYPELRHRWFSVVGVVPNFKCDSLSASPVRTLYIPQAQMPFRDLFFLVRTASSPLDIVEAVKDRIRGIDHELPLGHVASMEHIVHDSLGAPRLRTWLLGLFAALALVLASAGLYGLLAYFVARRRVEIGIRLALGADRREVLRHVMGQGLILGAQGIGLGIIVALLLTRFLGSLLYGVATADPLTYSVVALVLLTVAALASYRPASRAAGVDPAVALRD